MSYIWGGKPMGRGVRSIEPLFGIWSVLLHTCTCIWFAGCRADLCFVMDESGSIGTLNWQLMVNFSSNFVNKLFIDPTATQAGVVKFHSSAALSIALDEYSTTDSLKNAILALPYSSGGTRIHEGLRVAWEECFNQTRGMCDLAYKMRLNFIWRWLLCSGTAFTNCTNW